MCDEIQVWLIPLPDDGKVPGGLPQYLSTEESDRASRFLFERDRASFTVAHTAVRDILGRYLGTTPTNLRFRSAEMGKPYLPDYLDVRFNLSHSGRWALLAIARDREVGIDIECIRAERPTSAIAGRFFAPAEVRELMAFPEEQRNSAFFACWSRKEAYIKARGQGLGIPLDSFEVSLGEAAQLRKAADQERWSICSLRVPEGYAAALVVEGSGWRLRQLDWTFRPET